MLTGQAIDNKRSTGQFYRRWSSQASPKRTPKKAATPKATPKKAATPKRATSTKKTATPKASELRRSPRLAALDND